MILQWSKIPVIYYDLPFAKQILDIFCRYTEKILKFDQLINEQLHQQWNFKRKNIGSDSDISDLEIQ